MKNTIRCCISCILPCGALDVIRIVHSNGHVEEISGTVRASDIMNSHPKHVLKKPSSPSDHHHEGFPPKAVILPPEAELQRGKIYFLVPAPVPPEKKKTTRRRKKKRSEVNGKSVNNKSNDNLSVKELLGSDRYLSEILSEKTTATRTERDRRRGRGGVWRPRLESISESMD